MMASKDVRQRIIIHKSDEIAANKRGRLWEKGKERRQDWACAIPVCERRL